MGLLTANEIAVSRIQLLAIAFIISPPDYVELVKPTLPQGNSVQCFLRSQGRTRTGYRSRRIR
jgi:hypothetical protein